MRSVAETIPEIVAATGITHPNVPPHERITFTAVAWNEEARAEKLLTLARHWFSHMVVGVQESTDATLEIAGVIVDRDTDQLIQHPHYGTGDASMHDLVRRVKTDWAFVVAFDELPDSELLESLSSVAAIADLKGYDAVWVPFISIVEGVEYTEQHGHLRLFRSQLRWPRTMHSRPTGSREIWWPHGHILHERSLDEMMRDYLRIYQLGRGNTGWERHNTLMMHDACVTVAARVGWNQVTTYDWWPEVRDIAFTEETPWLDETGPIQNPRSTSSRRRR